jgi:3-(3-hydroxy-phenyl)propionate hydroxylase
MTPPTRGFRLLRDAVLSLSLTQPFVGPLYHWRTSRPHEYSRSPVNATDDDTQLFHAGPGHGAPPQNVQLRPDDHLLDHIDHCFTLLVFADSSEVAGLPDGLLDAVNAWRKRGLPLRVVAVNGAAPAIPMTGADATLADADGRVRLRYGVPESTPNCPAYLLRPDQHICARWLNLAPARLNAALHTATAQPGVLA